MAQTPALFSSVLLPTSALEALLGLTRYVGSIFIFLSKSNEPFPAYFDPSAIAHAVKQSITSASVFKFKLTFF